MNFDIKGSSIICCIICITAKSFLFGDPSINLATRANPAQIPKTTLNSVFSNLNILDLDLDFSDSSTSHSPDVLLSINPLIHDMHFLVVQNLQFLMSQTTFTLTVISKVMAVSEYAIIISMSFDTGSRVFGVLIVIWGNKKSNISIPGELSL